MGARVWCRAWTIRRRYNSLRFGLLGGILALGCMFTLYSKSYQFGVDEQHEAPVHGKFISVEYQHANLWDTLPKSWRTRHLLVVNQTDNGTARPPPTSAAPRRGIYPPDLFTPEQLRRGAVILHCLGMVYMFVALAIVCDEFFVPSLGVIIEKLQISDDVAGATFMAAGGSAPELFTSLFGVFLADSDVGIGTIVGSAVFNILFVIGMCAVFSKTLLKLTWWPLFRDVVFYSCSLIFLLIFFRDADIEWYESLVLFIMYFLYVLFMKFNVQVERFVKSRLSRTVKTISVAEPAKEIPVGRNRRHSVPHFRNTNMFRHGALQLMLHTIDPLSETIVQEKAVQMRAIAKRENGTISPSEAAVVSANGTANGHHPQNGQHQQQQQKLHHHPEGDLAASGWTDQDRTSSSRECIISAEHLSEDVGPGQIRTISHPNIPEEAGVDSPVASEQRNISVDMQTQSTLVDDASQSPSQEIPEEDIEEPLDISWPPTLRKRVTYVLLAPLVFPMWLLLPDVRREEKRKYFPVTFVGSILFIAGFSYLMLWWATVFGRTIGIKDSVMGITFLAAGTSIPDLITSVIVARKGLGDMAVSSSVGSNIFDITVGLPLPWLIYSITQLGSPATVESKGLFCSILLLFGMLLMVIVTIAVSRWRMTKTLGAAMFLLYVVFITISLLLESAVIPCLLTP
ncbi:sodium/potassium/calcium exchanger 2-like [Acanthaster planci]|uniref:Sodium/potassium/calcium exchanger 2-like n=1 Tax=Acanthaster planci TaxID=133434 RepID=A0A8B7ZM24_ACAPL|nr:sodium/potassium/calcium exchanger 2-like [Acanthaster planci]XP_022105918.1 sodium/potassium/calcium exchanger 2-like [Acanthaster planci]XP_022105927.1 sodium/potassium/calcium exchanger 2-like [Acanthaster planci]XP_022105935.1 sodium/potassium/calcium exchanger 2-like [Acanthaster planci]XP_022105945.1 sodium/potassium/calcium exchanger 2-like [Acanthaster planci]XP_022105953.1 sodium/potassium/calcium exchanger 2-like [Acanthaster planci]